MGFFDFFKSKEIQINNDKFANLMKLAFEDRDNVEKRAENGDLDCQIVLYTIYTPSKSNNSTIEKFVYYTKLAAHQNDATAQKNYGKFIFDNINELKNGNISLASVVSVKKRIEESLFWYRKAYQHGYKEVNTDIHTLETTFLKNWINPLIINHGLLTLDYTLSNIEIGEKLSLISFSEEILEKIYEEAIYLRYYYLNSAKSTTYYKAVLESYDFAIYICELLQDKGLSEFDPIALMGSYYLVVLANDTSRSINDFSEKEKENILSPFIDSIGANKMVEPSNYYGLIEFGAYWILTQRGSRLILDLIDKEKIIKERNEQ